jgi:pectinesterase
MNLVFLFALIQSLAFAAPIPAAPPYDFIVAADGSGDFRTIREAIDAVPPLRKKRTVILIRRGTYREKLVLPPTATNVTFVGEDALQTIITFDDYASRKNRFGEEMGTSASSTFFVFGDGFEARNLTFENAAGPVGQAVAVRVDGDRVRFENCRFLGFQDTLYPHGKASRQYYRNCYIEGTVDFIFGWSTAVFDSCTLFCKAEGYVTAASTEEQTPFGFVFRHCAITGSAAPGSFYLGRPWRPFAKVAFIDCTLSDVIRREGWHNWDKADNERTAFFAEYQSVGPGAEPAQRVPWSHQLTAVEAGRYTLDSIFGDWDPLAPDR